jgi:Protein of unknown function (DUF2971)
MAQLVSRQRIPRRARQAAEVGIGGVILRSPLWKHQRDHFYKYTTSKAAKAILENRTLQWSSADCFNDPFDSQFDLQITYSEDEVVEAVAKNHWEIVTGKRQIHPGNDLGHLLAMMAKMPLNLEEEEYKHRKRETTRESLKNGGAFLPQLQQMIREQLRDFKFLCLSETFDNGLMWSHYAHHHTGVVLQLSCISELDSVWGSAEPVKYAREMPVLFNQEGMISFLSGETSLEDEPVLQKVILSKAEDWAYEKEWRIGAPGYNPSKTFEYVRFNPQELTGIYLGCRMPSADKDALTQLVKAGYGHAAIFEGRKSDRRFAIEFEKI